MILARQLQPEASAPERPRIGLALSGGGFRASIFHLGVIRRLEELGIMRDVDVISAVSGGSIIAAYYACEMERRLRTVDTAHRLDPAERVRVFEEIAADFLKAVDHNLRTRALVFTPFYHPLLFVQTVISRPFRSTARSVLIQSEYDRWFYEGNLLDQLPSVTPERAQRASEGRPGNAEPGNVIYGPKLILNTTSLLSGERVGFSRTPASKMTELSKVDKNFLKLSRVVGASSGVPVLFPPTQIGGDILVDGGVSDNQGVEGLLDDDRPCDCLLVSDASGQMDVRDTIGSGEAAVFGRVNDILMFQVRAKLLEILMAWRREQPAPREFAFVHLYLNLKDREEIRCRVPSELIHALGRIRTDLDQFSYIEREALMYHGYTLIDSQLRRYCPELLARYGGATAPMRTPPLFREAAESERVNRERIRCDLEAGKDKLYLQRCARKYPGYFRPLIGLGALAALGLAAALLFVWREPLLYAQDLISQAIYGVVPWAIPYLDRALKALNLPELKQTVQGLSGIAALAAVIGLMLYLVSFPVYLVSRRLAAALDLRDYKRIAGTEPSTAWPPAEEGRRAVRGAAAGD